MNTVRLQGFEHPDPGGQRPDGEVETKKKLLCARLSITVISRAPAMCRVG